MAQKKKKPLGFRKSPEIKIQGFQTYNVEVLDLKPLKVIAECVESNHVKCDVDRLEDYYSTTAEKREASKSFFYLSPSWLAD